MRKLILYIAASIDGYIARENGDLNWLDLPPNHEKSDYNYNKLIDSVDTTFMGNSTYKWLIAQNIIDPYPGKKNYVFSNSVQPKSEFVEFINEDPAKFYKKIIRENGQNIWLVGGGKLNSVFLKENLIDEIILSIAPVVIGNGIKLFKEINSDFLLQFQLEKSETYKSGFVQITYKKIL